MKLTHLKSVFAVFFVIFFHGVTYGQSCNTMNIQWKADIPTTCPQMTMTMMHDILGRPYLYVANKEAGLKIYDVTNLTTPVLVRTVPVSLYDSLDVMNISQQGNYVFLALGNHFSNTQESGMAIVDVSIPANALVTDFYVLTGSLGGSGIVKADGNYAYLGAMKNGLIVLDITNKSDIIFKSQFIPDINYPTANPNPDLYNARGMEIKNDIVYLCYDAGGIRIINTVNKTSPVETGRFSNPALNGYPRAYNNVVLSDSLLYIAFDYCGVEILNVSDTSNMTLTGIWNPYNCPTNNWFSSPVHANEIHLDAPCQKLFISTGKSDLYVLDVANPSAPDSCNFYGGVSNNIGTWGVSVFQNQIYLSYVCAFIPFSSNWTGVKILTYTPCASSGVSEINEDDLVIYPVPSGDLVQVKIPKQRKYSNLKRISAFNILGKEFPLQISPSENFTLDLGSLDDGIYLLKMDFGDAIISKTFVKG